MINFNTPYTPEEVGYDSSRFSVLNNHFNTMIDKGELQGAAYCLSRDGKVFMNASLGRYCYQVEDTRKLSPDHIHSIASITKIFTATAIFKLFEDGKISLAQKVGEILEEFSHPPYTDITIGQLLTHTSGLQPDPNCFPSPYYQCHWDFVEEGFKNGDADWLKNALKAGLRTKPGAEWAYCSFGFCVLGEIITRVTGTFAHQYITENILKPCEMNDSMFKDALTKESFLRTVIRDEDDIKMHEAAMADLPFNDNPFQDLWRKVPGTGGGLFSTASDLVKFGTMLLQNGTYNGNRVLSRKAIEKMTSLAIEPTVLDYCWEAGGLPHPYGLGPELRCNLNNMFTPGTFYHEGAGSCSLLIDPTEKLVAAWFVPYLPAGSWYPQGLYHAANIMWSGLL